MPMDYCSEASKASCLDATTVTVGISAIPPPSSQFSHMLRKTAEEDDVFIKAKLFLTLAVVLLAEGAAIACTGAVIFFLVVPAVLLLSPLLILLSVLLLLYHKATRLLHQQSRSVAIYNQNSSLIAKVGVWSVMSDRYKTNFIEPLR